jgi:hypothetical protein
VTELKVPYSLSIVPLVLFLIAATLAWSRNWLLERANVQSWLRLAISVVAIVSLVTGAIGGYRVFEVPRPEAIWQPNWLAIVASTRNSQATSRPAGDVHTAILYRQALAEIRVWQPGAVHSTDDERESLKTSAISGWQEATENERRLLSDNQIALKTALDATARESCAFSEPTNCGPLVTLILLSARQLEADGRLDEALGRYVAVLRLARHVASDGAVDRWFLGLQLETLVGAWLPLWAAHPEQSPERIRNGTTRIAGELARFPLVSDAVRRTQQTFRKQVAGDWSEIHRGDKNVEGSWEQVQLSILQHFPWERTRAQRALDLVCVDQLQCALLLEQSLAIPGKDISSLAELVGGNERKTAWARRYSELKSVGWNVDYGYGWDRTQSIPWNWVETTPIIMKISHGLSANAVVWQATTSRELRRRAMLLSLELLEWKAAHGEYPTRLDELVGVGTDTVLDPYNAREFGYRPQGFPSPLGFIDGKLGGVTVVGPGKGVFWSAGPNNARVMISWRSDHDPPVFETAGWTATEQNFRDLSQVPLAFPLP